MMKEVLLNKHDRFLISNFPNLTPDLYERIFPYEKLNKLDIKTNFLENSSTDNSKIAKYFLH